MILFVAIGLADRQARFDDAALLLGEGLSPGSVYRLLAEHGDRLFGDEYFADLFLRSRLGRPTIPARTIATVMLLQGIRGAFRIARRVTGWPSICGGRQRRACRSGRGRFIRRCWSGCGTGYGPAAGRGACLRR
jgi:hypothetical protein